MKTLQQIEQEFDNYRAKTDSVNSLDDFLAFIEIGIDDSEEYQKDYLKELKENIRWKRYEKIRNFFFFIVNDEIDDVYDLDSDILKKCIQFTKAIGDNYKCIRSLAMETNFRELVRLVDFSSEYYYAQTDFYNYERDQLDLFIKGIDLFDGKYEDNGDVFLEFMNRKLKSLESASSDVKVPVYVKGRI